jgi:hypothetical protein
MDKLDSSKIFKRRSIKLGRIACNGNTALAHTSSIAIVMDSACCSPGNGSVGCCKIKTTSRSREIKILT